MQSKPALLEGCLLFLRKCIQLTLSPKVGFDTETGGRRKKGFNSCLSQGLPAIVYSQEALFQSSLSFVNTSATAQHKKLLCKKILTVTTIILTIGNPNCQADSKDLCLSGRKKRRTLSTGHICSKGNRKSLMSFSNLFVLIAYSAWA